MSYNRLGKSGLKVSKIILGAMSYGSKEWQQWVLEEKEALPLLKHAYDVGINTWDTVSVDHCSTAPVLHGSATAG
jgi:aryl-alcohol dehydrogenase-like predicted oxidoreductase